MTTIEERLYEIDRYGIARLNVPEDHELARHNGKGFNINGISYLIGPPPDWWIKVPKMFHPIQHVKIDHVLSEQEYQSRNSSTNIRP